MTEIQRAAAQYNSSNIACARIVLSDPVQYPEGSLMRIVAEMVLSKVAIVPNTDNEQ